MALRLRRDANHDDAVRLWTPGLPILTTNHVVGETWTFLRRRDGHPSAVTFLAAVGSAAWLTVVHVEDATEREARAWLKRHDERVYSSSMPRASPSCDESASGRRWHSTVTSARRASSRFGQRSDGAHLTIHPEKYSAKTICPHPPPRLPYSPPRPACRCLPRPPSRSGQRPAIGTGMPVAQSGGGHVLVGDTPRREVRSSGLDDGARDTDRSIDVVDGDDVEVIGVPSSRFEI